MEDLHAFVTRAVAALELGDVLWASDPATVDVLLDLAKDAAHGITRPAAPVATFLAGLAAGRAGGEEAAFRAAVETLRGAVPTA